MIWWQEVLGYIGLIFVVSSFFFKNIKVLRLLNMIGGSFCLIYSILTNSYANISVNAVCILINIIQLMILSRREKLYNIKNNINVNLIGSK